MEIEHEVKVLPIDERLQDAVKQLEAEGWSVVPGVVPVAVYHLVRAKQKAAPVGGGAGVGQMGIDDSKVMILRGGKLIPN